MSKGDMVPEVITTLLNRSKIGLMARDGSRHLSQHAQLDDPRRVEIPNIREVKDRVRNCGIVRFEGF